METAAEVFAKFSSAQSPFLFESGEFEDKTVWTWNEATELELDHVTPSHSWTSNKRLWVPASGRSIEVGHELA